MTKRQVAQAKLNQANNKLRWARICYDSAVEAWHWTANSSNRKRAWQRVLETRRRWIAAKALVTRRKNHGWT